MRHRSRRGTIYLMTMGTAMIVAVLATAALLTVRIQRGQIDDVSDTTRAQLYARAAIDMALFRIENDPDWRQKMKDGTWEVDQPIGGGTYSFQAVDPVDGDLTDEVYDPLEIVATGRSGPARQKLQVRLRVKQPGLRCLEPAIHAEKNLEFKGVTANSDHFVSSNTEVKAKDGAQVYADVEAADDIKEEGGVFHGSTTTEGDWPREMPDKDTVLDYYTTNGTWIDVEDLPLWDANLIDNPGGEEGTAPWYAVGCSLSQSTDEKSGTYSILVSGRNSTSDTIAQDVTEKLRSGETYHAELQVKPIDAKEDFRLVLKLVSTGDGELSIPLTAWEEIDDSWKKIEGDATVTWSGTLTQAQWYVETAAGQDDFLVDDAVFRVADAESDWRVIHRQLLSPAHNPFGAGTTNAQGIYVIDCAGKKISIKDSRISGTLVLLKQDKDSRIEGSITWAPATVGPDPSVPNLPALLTDKEINIATESVALDEGQANVNLNPAGTPYDGSEDSEKDDVYPSVISGVVYSEEKITLENHPTLHGVLVSEKEIMVEGTDLDVTYDPVYFEDNAPPGFRADPAVEIDSGSFKQVVD